VKHLHREVWVENKLWIAISLTVAVLWAVFIATTAISDENGKNLYIHSQIESFQSEIDVTVSIYESFSKYIFDESVNREYILKNVDEAYGSDEKKKAELRKELLDKLQDKYSLMTKYNFRQLQFQFPNGDSYLRFHSPDKFGDNLMDVRESIRIANTERRFVSGFEEGRIFNGYRFVYPIFLKEKHIGSVEISVSMATLVETLHNLNPDRNVFLAIDRSVVESTVFADKQSNYVESFFSNGYMFDREIYEKFGAKTIGTRYSESLIGKIRENAAMRLPSKESFGFAIEDQGKHYLVKFLKIANVSGKPVGYFLSIRENEQFREMYSRLYHDLIFTSIIFALFQAGIFIYMKDRAELRRISFHDKLTGLFNRHKFMEDAEREVERYGRYGRSLSVIMMDIDHFKNVNDTFGHSVGDKVLQDLSRIVSVSLREMDMLARWGGEEFIVMLPETNIDGARDAAEKIRSVVEGHTFPVVGGITVSLGISEVKTGEIDIEQAVNRADDALYRAKNAGRNRVSE
jgi:diguanylate cyclase (GGDEF)-like protein